MALTLPGPRGLPFIGVFPQFAREPLGFLLRMWRAYGDRVHYTFAGRPVIQLSHPDDVETMLLGAHRSLIKDEVTRGLSMMLGQGLVTSEGAHWRRQRRLAAPSFSRKHINSYGQTMASLMAEWADRQRVGAVIDVHEQMLDVSRDMVLCCLFGSPPGPEHDVSGPLHTFLDEFKTEAQGWRRVLPRSVMTPGRLRVAQARRQIDAVAASLIDSARGRGEGDDVLSRLVAARDDEGQPMTSEELRDEVVTFFTAGHETTAIALTQVLDLMGRHPEVMAKVAAEAQGVLAGRLPGVDDLPAMPYASAVVREVLRLRPPVWAVGREAIDDLELFDQSIPKGAQLFASQWVLHHDPRWYPSPWAFQPERWLDGLDKRLPRMAWVPFGGGPRVCIGNHFAMLEITLGLVVLAQRLTLRVRDWRPLRLDPTVTLRPCDPVRMTVGAPC